MMRVRRDRRERGREKRKRGKKREREGDRREIFQQFTNSSETSKSDLHL